MTKKKIFSVLLTVIMVLSIVPIAVSAQEKDKTVKMTDCGHFNVDWSETADVFSAGWDYGDINLDDVESVQVFAADKNNNIILEYTADKEQFEWQKNNSYITADSLSSVPFYKDYQGTAITEERDNDWTAKKGIAFDTWQPSKFGITVKTKDGIYTDEMNYDYAYPSVEITDCGHFTGADWAGEAGAYSVGWKYANFTMNDVTSIRVGAKDAKNRVVMEYTADQDQVTWQKANGYITSEGLSSAPFYKEYNGTPITEGRDDDWTVVKGDGFDIWQPTLFYVEIKTEKATYYDEMVYDYNYPHIHEAVHFEAKDPTCMEKGNTEYWYCADCGKYFSDEACTKEIALKDTVIEATGHGETEIKNAKDATCTEEGYTGDKVCKVCGEVVEKGQVISKLAHSFQDGTCSVCGAADPDYTPAGSENSDTNSPQTGENNSITLWIVLLLASAGVLTGTAILAKKRSIR